MKPDDREKAHLDYLLADFKALKVEIARRANLQRLTLAAYAAVYAGLFLQITSDRVASTSIAALWVVGALGLLFDVREGLEIKRLASLIRDRIASKAARLIATGPKSLIPSETDQANPRTDQLTRLYDVLFMWSVFFVLPLLLTALVVCRRWWRLPYLWRFDTSTPYVALVALIAATGMIWLLVKHFEKERKVYYESRDF